MNNVTPIKNPNARNLQNVMVMSQMVSASNCMKALDHMEATIITVYVQDSKPVITVQPCEAVEKLKHARHTVGRDKFNIAELCGCRVKWTANS